MRSVQVYIEGERLELFKDEDISIKSSQQSISDISKVMTDFSKSFNIPATPHNNAIMQHFYNSDVDATIDYNLHRDAFIEIDLNTFRKGKVSVDNAVIKNGQVESYSIRFFGDILSIKDKFGADELKDLSDLSILNHSHTASEVKDRITDGVTEYGVRYPLITRRDLTYETGSNDISHTGSDAIQWNELFPAVKLLNIFNAIQLKYGITFSGTFFGDKRFKNAYMVAQNANEFNFITATEDVEFSALSEDVSTLITRTADYHFDTSNHTLNYSYETFESAFNQSGYDVQLFDFHQVNILVTNISDTNATWYVDVYDHGNLINTVNGTGNVNKLLVLDNANNTSLNRSLSFKIRANEVVTMDSVIEYKQKGTIAGFTSSNAIGEINSYYYGDMDFTLSNELNVVDYMPKMKVIDFFKGVLNMFNLTCYNTGEDRYQIEPLDEWYLKGQIRDITSYIDNKTMKVAKPPLFKNISFDYKDSKSGNNTAFKDTFNRDYGSTSESFDYDGGDMKISLPFDNLMFNRFPTSNLQVGKTLDKDGQSYLPNPTIVYQYDNLYADYRFYNGSTTELLTEYVPFGQDVNQNGVTYSLNFSADESTLLFEPSTNNLFKTYYFDYLSSLYNLKNRLVTVKALLPVSVLSSIQLNDRLVIRDKRYIINEMKSKITTGEVEFQLMLDFREVLAEGGDAGTVDPIKPPSTAGCVDVRIMLPFGAVSADIVDLTGEVISISDTNVTEDTTISVCLPENTIGTDNILLEDGSGYIEQEGTTGDLLQEEGDVSTAVYTLQVTYNYSNGTQSVTYIYVQQQP
jgi:hypothetical protein